METTRMRIPDKSQKQAARRHRGAGQGLLVSLALFAAGWCSSSAETWVFPEPKPLRVHIVRGLWHRLYSMEAAMARCGGAILTESWHTSGTGGEPSVWVAGRYGGLDGFPGTAEQLAASHVVIVCNVNGFAFGRDERLKDLLRRYAENGGGVLFLGGRYAFGWEFTEQYSKALSGLVPVRPKEAVYVRNVPEGLPLSPGPDVLGAGLADLPWDRKPLNFWHHVLEPKTGAKVVLKAGDLPLLILGEHGKGRVAVFAGSVLGEPPAGGLPFWEWEGWPVILGEVIRWLSEPSAAASHEFSPEMKEKLAALTPELEAQTGAAASPLLLDLAQVCRCRESAKLLLHAAAEVTGDVTPGAAAALMKSAATFADGDCAADARSLAESGAPWKRLLGLRLLGKSRAPRCLEILANALQRKQAKGGGQTETAVAAADDPTERLNVEALTDPNRAVPKLSLDAELAALAAMGDFGGKEALPVLRQVAAAHTSAGLSSLKSSSMLSDENRLYEQAMVSRLCCGESEVAGEVVDLLLENLYLMSRARLYWDIVNQKPTRAQEALPQARAWQQELYERLQTVPESVLSALAKRLAAEQDWRVTPIAFAALACRNLPQDVKGILAEGKLTAVAALGQMSAR
jgi:uncharacterized membrane protein